MSKRKFAGRKNKGNDASLNNIKKMMQTADFAKSNTARNDIQEIAVTDIDVKSQVRKHFDQAHIQQLGESLKSDGQLQPIVVYPKDKDNHSFWILIGETRWRSAQHVGLETLKAIVVDQPVSEKDRIMFQLAENDQRKDLQPLERAKSYQSLLDELGSVNSVVELVKKPISYVSKHLSLLKMPEPVRAVYDAYTESMQEESTEENNKRGSWSPDTLNLLSKLYEEDQEAAQKLCKKACKGQISRDEIKVERQRAKSGNTSSEPNLGNGKDSTTNNATSVESGSKEVINSQGNSGDKPKEKGSDFFEACDPRRIIYQVSVNGEAGEIVNERVDADADFIWVRFKRDVRRVPCEDITLKRVLLDQ